MGLGYRVGDERKGYTKVQVKKKSSRRGFYVDCFGQSAGPWSEARLSASIISAYLPVAKPGLGPWGKGGGESCILDPSRHENLLNSVDDPSLKRITHENLDPTGPNIPDADATDNARPRPG